MQQMGTDWALRNVFEHSMRQISYVATCPSKLGKRVPGGPPLTKTGASTARDREFRQVSPPPAGHFIPDEPSLCFGLNITRTPGLTKPGKKYASSWYNSGGIQVVERDGGL